MVCFPLNLATWFLRLHACQHDACFVSPCSFPAYDDIRVWLSVVGRWVEELVASDSASAMTSCVHKVRHAVGHWGPALTAAGADVTAIARIRGADASCAVSVYLSVWVCVVGHAPLNWWQPCSVYRFTCARVARRRPHSPVSKCMDGCLYVCLCV